MSTALTLYSLESDLVALLDTEEMVEGEDQRLAILSEIAEKTEQAIAKRDDVIHFLRHLDLQQEAIEKEIERLHTLKESYARGQERVEKYVVSVIEQFVEEPKRGVRKLEGSIGVLSLRKNPDHVEVTEPGLVPIEYRDITITVRADLWQSLAPLELTAAAKGCRESVRKSEVAEAIKAGQEVPGCDIAYGENRLLVR